MNQAKGILDRLEQYFLAGQVTAYLVGGYLRNSLLSLPPGRDIDIAVAGDAQGIGEQLARQMGGTCIRLSAQWGVCRVAAQDSTGDPWTIDLSSLNDDIEHDLGSRDFTIDALALPVEDWSSPVPSERVIDPFNGLQDLPRKTIRAIGPNVFQDDPGRLLRAVRLAAQLRFRLEPSTVSLVLAAAPEVTRVSGERVRNEFMALLAMNGSSGHLEVLDHLDLLCRVIPELSVTKGVEQPREHYWDVWGHTMHAVEYAERVTAGHQNSPLYTLVPWNQETQIYFGQEVTDGFNRRAVLKLAALFHDIAKPQTKQVDGSGRTRFFGHSELGAEIAEARLTTLRLSARGVAMVAKMVEQHLRPTNMKNGIEMPTGRAIYRYFRDLGDVAVDTLYLCLADFLAAKGPEISPDDWANHAKMITHVLETGAHKPPALGIDRLISGHDIMQHFGLSPGPLIGRVLECLSEAQTTGEISTRDEALSLAAAALANHDHQS